MNDLEQFTGLYPLSKTLRFELKPEPATKKKFDVWLKEIQDNEVVSDYNLFYKDKISEAYVVLKPILDNLHEKFIEISLSSKRG